MLTFHTEFAISCLIAVQWLSGEEVVFEIRGKDHFRIEKILFLNSYKIWCTKVFPKKMIICILQKKMQIDCKVLIFFPAA